MRHARGDFRVAHLAAQRGEFIDFDDFDVPAEGGALQRGVGIDVEHAAVIVPHQAEAVVRHDMRRRGRRRSRRPPRSSTRGSSCSMPVI